MMLLENSFYTNPSDLATLLADKTKVADLFYMNFVGFTGLYKIKDAPAMGTYVKALGKLQIQNMTDANKDWSIVVKLALDAGVINAVAANLATKFLVNVRNGKLKGADIKDDPIRDILKACRIITHKPSVRIYSIVSDFIDGKHDLGHTSYQLWKISKLPEYKGYTEEMSHIITIGGYVNELIKHDKIVATPTSPAPVTTKTRQARGSLPPQGAAHGSDSDYMAALLHVFKLKGGIHSYLERFGFKGHFDVARFKKAVMSPEFVVSHDYHVPWEQHPFIQWIRKKDFSAASEVLRILNAKDRQTANIAAATQVSNTVAPPAPKPAVVIHTTPNPIITAESIRDLYLAKSKAEYQAQLAKYNIPPDPSKQDELFSKHFLDVKTHLYSFEVPGLDKAVDTEVWNGLMEAEFTKVLNGLRSWLKFVPIIKTIDMAAERKDEDAVFQIIQSSNIAHILTNASRSYNMVDVVTSTFRKLAGSDPASFVARHFYRSRKIGASMGGFRAFYDSFLDIWRGEGARGQIAMTLASFMLVKNPIDTSNEERQMVDQFAQLGVTLNLIDKVNFTFDKGSYDSKCPPNIKRLLEAISREGAIKLKVETLDTKALTRLRLENVIAKYGNSWMQDAKIEAINTLTKVEAEGLDISDILADHTKLTRLSEVLYQIVGSGNPYTAYFWLFRKITKTKVNWVMPQEYSSYMGNSGMKILAPYVDFLIAETMSSALLDVAPYALMFRDSASKVIEMAFTAMPEIKLAAIESFKKRNIGGSTAAQYTKYTYDEDVAEVLDANNLYQYAATLMIQGDKLPAGPKAAFALARKKWPEMFEGGAEYYWPGYGGSFFKTCWFMLPTSKHFSEAKETAMKVDPSWVSSQGQGFIDLFKLINPDLYSDWLGYKKKLAGSDMRGVVGLKDFIEPEEFSELAIKVITNVDTDAIKADLTHTNGTALKFLGEAVTNLNDKAKKVMLKKYAPAMDIVGVHNIRDRDQRDYVNKLFSDLLIDVYETDKHLANDVFANIPRTTRALIVKQQGETEYIEAIKEDLYKHAIRPDFPLDHNRIRTVLKYNNIPIKITSNKAIVKTIDDISDAVKRSIGKVGDLKISEPTATKSDLDRATIRLNKFRNNNHGEVGIKILRTFDVEFPGNKARQEAFRQEFPKDGTLKPVFHGTGTVAASMILRNGFQIIPKTDSSAVGRMLGNGIYFSNISNKASQYVGDKGGGVTRTAGTRGYVFEMEAEIGLRDRHYKSAGTGGSAYARSPEWAVFKPEDQLRIYKAYYVELVNISVIKALAAEYGEKLNESAMLTFDDFLYEAKEPKGMSTFWFMNNFVPTSLTDSVDAEEYKAPNGVFVEPFGDGGVMVSVEHSLDIDAVSVTIPNTTEWLMTRQEEAEKFFELINS